MNSTLTGPVATYLAQVRAELSDLPPGELADVLDDVTGHLTEVAAEFEDTPTAEALQDRLGTPREYADELRTAAGYPPRVEPAEKRTSGIGALRWGVIAGTVGPLLMVIGVFSQDATILAGYGTLGLIVALGAGYLGVRALRGDDPQVVLETPRGAQSAASIRGLIDQIPPNVRRELVNIGQPVWWVARGAVAGGGVFAVLGAGAVAVAGALVGAVVSVWIGRRSQQDRRWLWYVVPLNVAAAVVVPAAVASSFVVGGHAYNDSGYNYSNGQPTYSPDGLSLNGTEITNIYPFDAQGRQVSVRLYNQDGDPINLRLRDCAVLNDQSGRAYEEVNQFPLRAAPEHGTFDPADCKDTDKAPFVPPAVSITPTSTPSSTPSSKPTTSPTPGTTLTVAPTR